MVFNNPFLVTISKKKKRLFAYFIFIERRQYPISLLAVFRFFLFKDLLIIFKKIILIVLDKLGISFQLLYNVAGK